MKKNSKQKPNIENTKNIEDRLVGTERRLSDLERQSRDTYMQTISLANALRHHDESMIKFEDKLIAEFEQFRSKMYTLIDPLVGELKKFNEEQGLHEAQHKEIYDDLDSLKKIHPKGIHLTP